MAHSNINRVVLVGRLTHDPELRALPSGLSICSLRVACNSSRRDTEGDYQQQPNYFDVSALGAQAEAIARYCTRGRRVAIDGRLAWREWETEDQQRRQAVSVFADSIEFLDGPDTEIEPDEPEGDQGDQGEPAGVAVGSGEEEFVF